jgi:DNA-binding winged helix-turn-helix (wHTH) protein
VDGAMASRNRLRFGEFTLDLDARQLFKQTEEIHLSPKGFELLHLLVQDRPRAISKADLQTRLWPDAFVTEASLFGLIREIRLVLGEDPRHPRFIRTLHGFGYAFAAGADDAAAGIRPDPSHPTFWILADSQVRLAEGVNILGRDPDATVWFDRPGVSRRHARIVVNNGEAAIEDLESTNGTWLRDERVTGPTPLADGDVIRLGPVAVTFRIRRAAASTEALL